MSGISDRSRRYWEERRKAQGLTYVARRGQRESYDEQKEAIEPILRTLVPSGRVLDFGCGPGRFRDVLEEKGEYTGVDLISGLGTTPLESDWGGPFNSAVAVMALQHIVGANDYRHWVRSIYDSLMPRGLFIVVDHEWMLSDPHMEPRGPQGVMKWAPFSQRVDNGHYDGHWVSVFVK